MSQNSTIYSIVHTVILSAQSLHSGPARVCEVFVQVNHRVILTLTKNMFLCFNSRCHYCYIVISEICLE